MRNGKKNKSFFSFRFVLSVFTILKKRIYSEFCTFCFTAWSLKTLLRRLQFAVLCRFKLYYLLLVTYLATTYFVNTPQASSVHYIIYLIYRNACSFLLSCFKQKHTMIQHELSTCTWSDRAPWNRGKFVSQPEWSKRFLRIFPSFELGSAYHLSGIFGNSRANSNGTVHPDGKFSEKG